jgi:predicted DNA-binding transcriptional regulator AlpA
MRAKPSVGSADRPPSWMGVKELAWELSCSETTVGVLEKTGRIPPPVKLTPGCVRWYWPAVQEWLAKLTTTIDDGDPYMAGAVNAT